MRSVLLSPTNLLFITMPIELPPGTAATSERNPEPRSFDFFKLAVIVVAIVMALFFGASALSGAIVSAMPIEVEQQLGKAIVPIYEKTAKPGATQAQLNQLLDQLEAHLPASNPPRNYQILYFDEPTVNAAAIPGDRILVYRGLLEQAESENELMMVLGHELGHFQNRDHLRGLGNALLYQIAFSSLFGDVGSIFGMGASMVESVGRAQFSQQQETQADEIGIMLLNQQYGHVAGATEFFDRMSKSNLPDLPWLASHPAPADRVEHLKKLIRDRQYLVKAKRPMQGIR
jgi:predicted Zn-dependent protease